ncbi:hypothetical protein I4U23_008092 [Adineta vaga]|nr:hypothetical protein I4U23_008092 [Adineta vaga]
MSRPRQDSNGYYDKPNNNHVHRAMRIESNVTNSQQHSFDNLSAPQRTNRYSSQDNHASPISSIRNEGLIVRDSYQNHDNKDRVIFRNPHLRVNDGHSGGFSEQHTVTNQTVSSNAGVVAERRSEIQPSQRALSTNYTSPPIRQTIPINGRGCVVDINITISTGGRVPRTAVNTSNDTFRSPSRPTTTTTTFDNVHYIDLDLHAPPNTATFSTDGNARPSS